MQALRLAKARERVTTVTGTPAGLNAVIYVQILVSNGIRVWVLQPDRSPGKYCEPTTASQFEWH